MAITSESQVIDVTTISQGCSIIEEAAADYTLCANKVKEAADICTSKVLSVEKKSMQPSLNELAASISTIENNISFFTAEIRSKAMQIQTKQLQELAEYRAAKAAREAEAAESAAKAAASTAGNQ